VATARPAPRRALARARALMPSVSGAIIADASHDLTLAQPE
jgi:hypothetical protein